MRETKNKTQIWFFQTVKVITLCKPALREKKTETDKMPKIRHM